MNVGFVLDVLSKMGEENFVLMLKFVVNVFKYVNVDVVDMWIFLVYGN